jgi:hypothetical protein
VIKYYNVVIHVKRNVDLIVFVKLLVLLNVIVILSVLKNAMKNVLLA